MYYLNTYKNEIKYYKEKSKLLLKKSKTTYGNKYDLFLRKDKNIESKNM